MRRLVRSAGGTGGGRCAGGEAGTGGVAGEGGEGVWLNGGIARRKAGGRMRAGGGELAVEREAGRVGRDRSG